MGERGLATKYLWENMDPAADPMGPDNVLIFATGPLTGTMASTSGRYAVVTKGPLTGAIACSNSGGKFGAELKYRRLRPRDHRGPLRDSRSTSRSSTTRSSSAGRRDLGHHGLAHRGMDQGAPSEPADQGRLDRRRRREGRALRLRRQRPAPGRRALRRRRGHGLQEPQGGRRAAARSASVSTDPKRFMDAVKGPMRSCWPSSEAART